MLNNVCGHFSREEREKIPKSFGFPPSYRKFAT